eukprot:2526257-Rhodomonas_salina.1
MQCGAIGGRRARVCAAEQWVVAAGLSRHCAGASSNEDGERKEGGASRVLAETNGGTCEKKGAMLSGGAGCREGGGRKGARE